MVRCRAMQKRRHSGGTNRIFVWLNTACTPGRASMRKLLIYAVALQFSLEAAIAQPAATPENQSLSLDQQEKISQIIADQTPQPLTNVAFPVARDAIVPANILLQPLPPEAEMISVHL